MNRQCTPPFVNNLDQWQKSLRHKACWQFCKVEASFGSLQNSTLQWTGIDDICGRYILRFHCHSSQLPHACMAAGTAPAHAVLIGRDWKATQHQKETDDFSLPGVGSLISGTVEGRLPGKLPRWPELGPTRPPGRLASSDRASMACAARSACSLLQPCHVSSQISQRRGCRTMLGKSTVAKSSLHPSSVCRQMHPCFH